MLNVNPSALFFNAVNNQAAIQNNSVAPGGTDPAGGNAVGLRVADGKSLLLVGGNVSIDGGKLNAYGGRVELGGLAAPGSINLLFDGDNLKLGFSENVTRADVSLTNKANVGVISKGGSVAVNARNLNILGSSIVSGVSSGGVNTQAGNIEINTTDTTTIDGTSSTTSFSGIASGLVGGSGSAGDITINTGSLDVINAVIGSLTNGEGNAGNVTITAKDKVSLTNGGITSIVASSDGGNGANVSIEAQEISLANSAIITNSIGKGSSGNIQIKAYDSVFVTGSSTISSDTFGQGNAGSIDIEAGNLISFDGVGSNDRTRQVSSRVNPLIVSTPEFTGERIGGDINIKTSSLSIKNANLETSTYGKGNAGNVQVRATDAVSLIDANIFSTVEAGGDGEGGNIDINAATLSLTDSAQLQTIIREASESDTQPPGKGNAGNVNVKVTGLVDIAGERNNFYSRISSSVGTGTEGNGGNITIDSGSFLLRDGAELETSTYGIGNAGNVKVTATDAVSLADNAYILSTVEAGGVGKGGNIDINAATLSLTDGAQLLASTYGIGNAGNVQVRATDAVSLVDALILSTVEAGGEGQGGNINIDAATLTLRDSAQLITITREASDTQPAGLGDAGNVNVKVSGLVDIAGEKNDIPSGIFSYVDTGTEGDGGNITVDSSSFLLRDGARLRASTYGIGDAGNVQVRATDAVSLTDAKIFSTVEAGGVGKGGDININAATLSLTDGAQLQTLTRKASDTQSAGQGDAGNVNVKVTGSVDIAGEKNGFYSGMYSVADTGTVGNAGNITIDSGSFSLRDGALINARTKTDDQGGDVTVNTDIFEAFNGGQLVAITSGNGSAGKITVNASEKTTISGSDPNYNYRLTQLPDYVAIIGANSGLFVNSSGSGSTGDIEVSSPQITLDNQGTFNANSASGNGGNINLTSDLLLMRRGAQISTNAGTAQQGGDGGNININSKFIVAPSQENSDITANAFSGTGGNVEILSQGIFGIEPRDRQTDKSDITASSELGVPGNLNLTDPDDSSIRNNLNDLPDNQIDTNTIIANSCVVRNDQQNGTFLITGSGGLPQNPSDAPLSSYSTGSIRSIPSNSEKSPVSTTRPTWKIGDSVVEPQGVYKLPNGQLVLSRECK